jgi:hypothetical protein
MEICTVSEPDAGFVAQGAVVSGEDTEVGNSAIPKEKSIQDEFF